MHRKAARWARAGLGGALLSLASGTVGPVEGASRPTAIFHAFDQSYRDVEGFVCDLAPQGYSHVQIAPAQRSNPGNEWWARYQPVDYGVIEGRGSEDDLRALVSTAHGCGIRVIADVVFNHMANMPQLSGLDFPQLSAADFHRPACDITYDDGNRDSELRCWMNGSLPDLDQSRAAVMRVHKEHLDKLLALGVDGFRFDAAKHMPAAVMQQYFDHVDAATHGEAWSYLEVIQDADTSAQDYTGVAAVTDFLLYASVKSAFGLGGDLRTLRVPGAVDDPRSVTFGRCHDNIKELNAHAINPYEHRPDALLATTHVLAREDGTPLVLNWDNHDSAAIRAGVRFRRIMRERGAAGADVADNVLAVIDSPTALIMERGPEGFYVVNKGADRVDVPALDMTLTKLDGCYRELRNDFNVAIERREDGRKWVTRWGTWARGGVEIQARDALYFIREPWSQCQMR